MGNEVLTDGLRKGFEEIKEIDENGIEYWRARKLMPVLDYATWRSFEEVIKKAQKSCVNSGQAVENHFADAGKMVQIGYGNAREVQDWKLSRYACYLIAQKNLPAEKHLKEVSRTVRLAQREKAKQLPKGKKSP